MSRAWMVQDRPWLGRRVTVLDLSLPVAEDDPPGPCTQALQLEQEEQYRAECERIAASGTRVLYLLAAVIGVWAGVAVMVGGVQ